MIIGEFRPALSGKQSAENPDTGRLSNVPSALPLSGVETAVSGQFRCPLRVVSGQSVEGGATGITTVRFSDVYLGFAWSVSFPK